MNVPARWLATAVSVAVAILWTPLPGRAATLSGYANDLQAGQIVELVNSDPADFGGVAGDLVGNGLGVYVVSGHESEPTALAVLSKIQGIVSPNVGSVDPTTNRLWSVHIVSVAHSLNDLNSVMSEVPTRQPWAQMVAPTLTMWGVDVRDNAIRVGVAAVTSDLSAEASATFGNLVQLEVDGRIQTADRYNDTSPFYGGDSLNQVQGTKDWGCTAGFPAHDANNHPGLLTAGHCFDQNSAIYQGYSPYPPPQRPAVGTKLGWVTILVFGGSNPTSSNSDGAFVDVTRDPCCTWQVKGVTWGLGYSVLNISGAISSWQGANACANGDNTGQNCSGNVKLGPLCAQEGTGFYVCNLWAMQSTNGSTMVVAGDSGGPVYQGDGSGGVRAMGLIHGYDYQTPQNFYYADINALGRQLNIALILNSQVW